MLMPIAFRMHVRTDTRTLTPPCTHIRTQSHAHLHARTHTHTHTHDTYAHTHAQARPLTPHKHTLTSLHHTPTPITTPTHRPRTNTQEPEKSELNKPYLPIPYTHTCTLDTHLWQRRAESPRTSNETNRNYH